ncbi:uncharacterized protein LOC143898304 [Temnothorax americanus]|uniref:uncharacterized protein LOC143898304 n=1 Tax=Temnothorax americanus TaxID=1964332 RepID=UPI0040677F1C
MSITFTLTGKSSILAEHYFPAVDLSDGDYELGLTCFETYHTIPNALWQKLNGLYGDTTEDAKQRYWQQFYEFRISDGEPVATQIEKFETICRKPADADETVSEAAIMSKLLSSLPTWYSAFRMAWECTAKAEQKKENLIARIIREDKRLTSAEEEVSSLALQVKNLQVKSKKQSKAADSDQHGKKKVSVKTIEKLKKKRPCNYCKEVGHWYRECKKRLADKEENEKKKDSNEKKKDEESGSAYTSDISVFFLETTDKDDSVWLADSGASMHMTSRRDFFREIGPTKPVRFVKVAGDKVLPVVGVGTIDIQASVNKKLIDRQLKNVLFVPDLKRNLFSVGAITDRKFSFHSYHNRCEIRDDSGALSVEGVRHGYLFRMLFNVKIPVFIKIMARKARPH